MTNQEDLKEAVQSLLSSYKDSFINGQYEFIAHLKSNQYICLKDCKTPQDIECKVLEWLSRPSFKTTPYSQEWRNRAFHEFMLNGLNCFLDTNFSEDDIALIYDKLGNRINHDRTVAFVNSGMSIEWLSNINTNA